MVTNIVLILFKFFLSLGLCGPISWSSSCSYYCSVPQSGLILCDPMDCITTGILVLHYLLEFAQTHVLWVNDAVKPSHPLSPTSPLPSVFPSIKVFSSESALWYQGIKVVELQLQHQSFQWIFGLISFRIDWFDLLAAQRTLKSLLQHHSSKALILQCSAFFMAQLSHPYMTTGKTHIFDNMGLCQQSDICVFNMLSRIAIAFLPRSKHLLISWVLSPAVTVPLEPKKIKSVTVSIVSPSVCHEVMGLDAMISVFWMLSFKPAFPLSFIFSKRSFSFSLLSAMRVVLYEVVDISPGLIAACTSSSLEFCMIYSA